MASNLHNKINSYPIELGFEFNETYSLNPTLTGSAYTNYSPRLTINGGTSGNATVWEPLVGPNGGAGSWKVTNTTTAPGGSQLRTTGTSMTPVWVDGDYSTGIWVMFSNLPDYAGDYVFWRMGPNSSSAGFAFYLNYNSTTGATRFKCDLNYTAANTNSFIGPAQVEVGKWYFLAVRKTTVSQTGQSQIWIDGQLVQSGNNTYSSTSNYFQLGTTTSLGAWSFNACNWYCATYSTIGANEIADIYNVGNQSPRTVKYFDGTSWKTSSAQKVWNGTAWVDWNAKRYDGSAWVTV